MLRARRRRGGVRLEITPLIDVVFVLLTFFVFAMIVTTRVSVTEVELPEVEAGVGEEGSGAPVVVALTREGEVLVEGEGIGSASDGGLGVALSEALAVEDVAGRGLAVAIGEGSLGEDLLSLMDGLREAGVEAADFWRRPRGGFGGGDGGGDAGAGDGGAAGPEGER